MSNINKTILILTAQFGAGHVSAANAIKEYILEKNPNYNIVIQNFINASIPRINNPMVKIYERNTKSSACFIHCNNNEYDCRHIL